MATPEIRSFIVPSGVVELRKQGGTKKSKPQKCSVKVESALADTVSVDLSILSSNVSLDSKQQDEQMEPGDQHTFTFSDVVFSCAGSAQPDPVVTVVATAKYMSDGSSTKEKSVSLSDAMAELAPEKAKVALGMAPGKKAMKAPSPGKVAPAKKAPARNKKTAPRKKVASAKKKGSTGGSSKRRKRS